MSVGATTEVPTCDHAGGGLPKWRLRRVTQYIEQNLKGNLRLAELSQAVHMSPYHFARLFKEGTGVSPHQFVIGRRIEAARVLLAAPRVPITAVARAVGFTTQSHFATTFRHSTGMTPSMYRRRRTWGASVTAREYDSTESVRALPGASRSGGGQVECVERASTAQR